jgi:hypothetical protein
MRSSVKCPKEPATTIYPERRTLIPYHVFKIITFRSSS